MNSDRLTVNVCHVADMDRAPVNISQSDVRTSMVLNLDVRYALAFKSDVTLHAERQHIFPAIRGWKMASKNLSF